MIKNLTQFKYVIQGLENTFLFDVNCPTHVAKEALFECLKWLGQLEDQAKANQEAQKASEEAQQVNNPEPQE